MRLIDADALKPYRLNEHYKYRLVYDADDVENAPSIDAVSVVRCRECKWYGGDGWESDESKRRHWCNRVSEWGKCIHVNADDFCSYGERKESE